MIKISLSSPVSSLDKSIEVLFSSSKYVETLQRSNEQMVKLANLIQKKESKTEGLTSSEKEEIYDLLNSEMETLEEDD